uniref:Putative zinc finger Ran-binding domain-containing protein 2-like isoform X1 n=1 Tax=Davidia involucrata TaxID=16924 RepID=A0A5B6YG15_DAVIN
MSREGDWMCSSCQEMNFKWRDSCYSCGWPKSGDGTVIPRPLAGDWYCTAMNCGAHNYASRTSCHRCSAAKYGCAYEDSPPPGWKRGDWICPRLGCGVHNYASRTECFKCRTPRDCGGAV